MEKKQIPTFVKVIIIIVISLMFFSIILGFGFMSAMVKQVEKPFTKEQNPASLLENKNTLNQSSNTIDINKNINIPEQPQQPTISISGKNSTASNPLSVGEWGIACIKQSGKYVNVPVKITNVLRGDSAAVQVKDYCDSGRTIYKYKEPEESVEWAVISYLIDLTNVEPYYDGSRFSNVYEEITGINGKESIKYNEKMYYSQTMSLSDDYSKETIADKRFAAMLPIGCKDYRIIFGLQNGTSRAFFKGE